MWTRTTNCIREATGEVLGFSKGNFEGHKGVCWWLREVQVKVGANKVALMKLVERKNEDAKRTNKERHEIVYKEAQMTVTMADDDI